jgi:solute carrier family 25 (mitochondrial 2-oxodicarboxylate transporter), member 21
MFALTYPKQTMTTKGRTELSTGETLFAGASAGLLELMIMFPLDVVKTRMQLAAEKGGAGVLGSLRAIVAEGGVGRLYRGIAAPMVQEPIKRSIKFTGNQFYSSLLPDDNLQSRFASGWLAGCTECFGIAPFEVVKVRMQASNRVTAYTSVPHCASEILKHEGVMGFTRGLESSLWRQGSWNSAYFSTIWYLKKGPMHIDDEATAGKSKVMARNFAAGFVGGSLGTIVNTPFDVVVSRMRNVLPGEVSPYRWAFQSLALIAKEEGFGALYKGFGPKIMRLGNQLYRGPVSNSCCIACG